MMSLEAKYDIDCVLPIAPLWVVTILRKFIVQIVLPSAEGSMKFQVFWSLSSTSVQPVTNSGYAHNSLPTFNSTSITSMRLFNIKKLAVRPQPSYSSPSVSWKSNHQSTNQPKQYLVAGLYNVRSALVTNEG
ncbi:unnamed protein product [Clavelina lepadiformis]|uniref:Uncharacterized protein n=1 Tax=Clavelina lepadiformis TaxID=159417 RepID=A0ABP0FGG5_CLALP